MSIEQTNTRYNKNFYYYSNDAVIGKSLKEYGEYGQIEVDFLLNLINSNTIVYDVGANIGYYSCAFASKSRQVYSFEPNIDNYNLLVKNTKGCNNVEPFNWAVGAHNGKAYIESFDMDDEINYGGVKVAKSGNLVDMRSIDNMNLEYPPDLVKIDVEGFEYFVILGMELTIRRKRPVIYFEALETTHFREIYHFLSKFEYDFYWTVIKNYNENNFFGNKNNVFENTALSSVLVWPKSLGKVNLKEVEGEDDNPWKFFVNNPIDNSAI